MKPKKACKLAIDALTYKQRSYIVGHNTYKSGITNSFIFAERDYKKYIELEEAKVVLEEALG